MGWGLGVSVEEDDLGEAEAAGGGAGGFALVGLVEGVGEAFFEAANAPDTQCRVKRDVLLLMCPGERRAQSDQPCVNTTGLIL